MRNYIVSVTYYLSIQLLYASAVGCAAWVLTSIRSASATTKYWIWVVATFNFVVPLGAVVDKLWAPHLAWAVPLGTIGAAVSDMTKGRMAFVLAAIWISGALAMLVRLIYRICREHYEARYPFGLSRYRTTSGFLADGIPVSFDNRCASPAVSGFLNPHISLPIGIDQILNRRELDAVLFHELAHAKRRDNLIQLLYELSLCVLWFHPIVWLAGAPMGLYRELSCDECVIQRAYGRELVSALAKLALPERRLPLQAAASSHLSYRLARLAGSAQTTKPAATVLVTSVFAIVIAAALFQTIAHTACCFVVKH